MLRAIRDYRARTGQVVGFKPAGGIRTPAQALEWMRLVADEVGEEWLRPERFRLGASTLLGEIERRLELLAA
jgi:deoxyribose-phosphate aldolase